MDEDKIEYWGNLKLTLEQEGDGYFFYGYGLPKEYRGDQELVNLFNKSEKSIDDFKDYIENKITEYGGNLEDWSSF